MKLELHSMRTGMVWLTLFGAVVLAGAQEVKYKARVRGLDNGSVEKTIESSALTFKLTGRPPATIGQLRRRINDDLPRIKIILESQGYYDSSVSAEVDTERDPVRVTFRIEPGVRYQFQSVHLQFSGPENSAL